jgi:hypothetical protein
MKNLLRLDYEKILLLSTTIFRGDYQITLKLPEYSDIRRRNSESDNCQYLSSFYIDYLWYEGKLISERANRFNVPEGEYIKVVIYFNGSGQLSDGIKSKFLIEPWRMESALPHKKFPLEYYPKYYWDDPDTPSEASIKRASLDSRWGIRDTKYLNPLTSAPFTAFCSIPPLNASKPNSRIENDFAEYGDSKCRGSITAAKKNKFISVTIDVWAHLGNDQKGILQINHIYNAVVEELQSFIQE